MKDAPQEVQNMFRSLMADIEKTRDDAEIKEIKKDPAAHKLTRIFVGNSARYIYWDGGKNNRGDRYRFCWTKHRNAAGYFLAWREIHYKNTRKDGTYGKRDQYAARKVKHKAMDLSSRRCAAFKKKQVVSK